LRLDRFSIYGSAVSDALGQVLILKQMGPAMAHQNIIPDRPFLTIGGCIYLASAAPWFFILAGVWVAIGVLALAVLIVAASLACSCVSHRRPPGFRCQKPFFMRSARCTVAIKG
jgi:hypothetical protein